MSWSIVCGDAAAVLAAQPEASVHTVVTSPPYWQLRDYGVHGAIGPRMSELHPRYQRGRVQRLGFSWAQMRHDVAAATRVAWHLYSERGHSWRPWTCARMRGYA